MERQDLILRRLAHSAETSLGVLSWPQAAGRAPWRCFVIEDERRNIQKYGKKYGETRIPAGRYRLGLRRRGGFHSRYLRHFGADFHKGMVELQAVPHFTHVLIHMGNTDEDTAGCLLLNRRAAFSRSGDFVGQESRRAYQFFYPRLAAALLARREMWLRVQEESLQPL